MTAIPYAPTREEAISRGQRFAKRYRRWYPKAVAILDDEWDRLVTFYNFPEAHWQHLCTTNVVESPFAAVRLRTSAKRFEKVANATALIRRLLIVAEQLFRRLNAPELVEDVYRATQSVDGQPVVSKRRVAA